MTTSQPTVPARPTFARMLVRAQRRFDQRMAAGSTPQRPPPPPAYLLLHAAPRTPGA